MILIRMFLNSLSQSGLARIETFVSYHLLNVWPKRATDDGTRRNVRGESKNSLSSRAFYAKIRRAEKGRHPGGN
jgi:hypothetical protein